MPKVDQKKGIGCFIWLLFVGLIGYFAFSINEKEKAALMPLDEKQFVETVEGYRKQYNDAPNPIQKTATFRERAAALKSYAASPKVTGWVGTLALKQAKIPSPNGANDAGP